MSRYQTWLAITMLAGGFAQAWADPPLQRARELQAQGLTAYKAADFEAAAEDFAAALALRPHDPAILYNFAACSAKAGRVADAIAALDAYATMGLIADVEDDSDFAGLNDQAAFKAVLAKFAVNSAPIGASQRVATISGEPFLAEGIAFDAATQRFFVSSVDRRKIVVVAHDGRQSEFATAQSSGLLGAFGMAIDAERRLLWVSATGVAHAQPLTGAERGTAGVFAYDLADGRLLSKTLLPKTTDQRIIGDIAVTSDGAVFAPDSVAPVIYMLGDDGRTIAPWLSNENFSSLQGITTTPDGIVLLFAYFFF